MTSYVAAELRRRVVERADGLCEYCLIHQSDTYLGCQIDHVVSEKHGGPTVFENLALACVFCNRAKGSDIASLTDGATLTRLFNPRVDAWRDHFRLESAQIVPLTDIGEVTVSILGFNLPERFLERQALTASGRYPCPPAAGRIGS